MQGFLLLNKPNGITSFGAVRKIKKLTSEKRIGHTGTLDPMATGVLPVFIGRATALSSHLLDAEKTYTATVLLGTTTDTLDITGTVLTKQNVTVNNDDVLNALKSFKCKYSQTPPMYSAIKKDGVRMYDLARNGKVVDIPEREVQIYDISLTSPLNEKGEFSFTATVSKGTYIRSLARDIGVFLGCGACLSELCRTNASGFDIKDAVKLDDLTEDNILSFLMPEEFAVKHFKEVSVSEKQAIRFSNGGQLDLNRINNKNLCAGQITRVKYKDIFIGLGIVDEEKQELAIKCVINKV